jgi:hypothetical protein
MIQQLNIEQLRSAKISIMNEEREIKTLWTSYVNIDSSSLFVHGKNRLGIWLNISAAEIFSTIKANCYFTLTGKYEHFSQH